MTIPNPVPAIGRIVHYKLSSADADAINTRIKHAQDNLDLHRQNASGVVIHVGNMVTIGAVYPAMIVRVWGDQPTSVVQLQVFIDGNHTYWATSRACGDGEGQWVWPVVR